MDLHYASTIPDSPKALRSGAGHYPKPSADPGGKASTYQAQGNLQEAARWLSGIDWQNPSGAGLQMKLDQCKLERNYGELIRLAQAQLTQTDDQNIKVAM